MNDSTIRLSADTSALTDSLSKIAEEMTAMKAAVYPLPSGRKLAYVKPRIGMNQFGGESVTYEGVGTAKKWERI